jgi:hypothetical protein
MKLIVARFVDAGIFLVRFSKVHAIKIYRKLKKSLDYLAQQFSFN